MNEKTFNWLKNISDNQWNKLNRNEITITVKGEEMSVDIKDYRPPFNIKILEIRYPITIAKFSIEDFDFVDNIAMEIGKYYIFGRWCIHINSLDEKKKECVIKIREGVEFLEHIKIF